MKKLFLAKPVPESNNPDCSDSPIVETKHSEIFSPRDHKSASKVDYSPRVGKYGGQNQDYESWRKDHLLRSPNRCKDDFKYAREITHASFDLNPKLTQNEISSIVGKFLSVAYGKITKRTDEIIGYEIAVENLIESHSLPPNKRSRVNGGLKCLSRKLRNLS